VPETYDKGIYMLTSATDAITTNLDDSYCAAEKINTQEINVE
jgi:hypothetical protein